jgi:hypothetical protein
MDVLSKSTCWASTAFAIIAIALSVPANSQPDLPPKVQADILKRQIFDAFQKGRSSDVLAASDQFHALESQGITIPPGVLWIEANAADKSGDSLRAYDAVTAYLKVAESTDQGCAEPLQKQREALIPKVEARGCADAINLDRNFVDREYEDASR